LCLLLSSCSDQAGQLTVSGRIEVDDIHVGSKLGGRVERVNFEEGDAVSAGGAVAELEAYELEAMLQQAEATTSQAQAQLNLLTAGTRQEEIDRAAAVVAARQAELELRRKGFRDEEVHEADAALASAASSLELARKEFERSAALLRTAVIDRSEYDRRRMELQTAQATHEVARQRQALVKSGSRPEEIAMAEAQLQQARADLERLRNGPRPEEIAAQRAAVDAAAASIEQARTQLAETRIVAPVDAIVETLDLEPGDLVRAGQTVAVLNLKNSPWVRCYVPENRLADVRPGMEVGVTIDSLPGRTLRGKVRRLASEAEFTPRNVQTTEKRAELVFEMKVDVLESTESLRAGMYADVHVAPSR
jgi:HlyD family secretion protein